MIDVQIRGSSSFISVRMCGSVGNFEIGKVMISVTAFSGRILSQVCCFAWCISVVIILGFCILFFICSNFLQLNVSDHFFFFFLHTCTFFLALFTYSLRVYEATFFLSFFLSLSVGTS